MAILGLANYYQVAQYEGKGGFMVFSDGAGTWYPETERASYNGGGIIVDVPQAGQLEPYQVWIERVTNAVSTAQQEQVKENMRKLQEGTYNNPPEPVKMISEFDTVTGKMSERPEHKAETDARLEREAVREAGDLAIQHGHITHEIGRAHV